MRSHEIKFTNADEIFQNYQKIETAARRARAEMVATGIAIAKAKITGLVQKLVAWNNRRVATAELMNLDDRMLADIGIGRNDIQARISASMNTAAANSNDRDQHAA